MVFSVDTEILREAIETVTRSMSDYFDDLDELRVFIQDHPEYSDANNLREYCTFPHVNFKKDDSGAYAFLAKKEYDRFKNDCQVLHDVVLHCREYERGLLSGGSGPGIHNSCRQESSSCSLRQRMKKLKKLLNRKKAS